jgi:hypothetical protein
MRRIEVPRAFGGARGKAQVDERVAQALEQIAEMLTIQTEIMVEEHNAKVASNLSMHAGQRKT